MSSRVHRSIMNMKVGMLFYFLSLFLAFYSRKIFLDCLGADFIGLTGALYNILSFLAVAELGTNHYRKTITRKSTTSCQCLPTSTAQLV